jgi:hypothetical protein
MGTAPSLPVVNVQPTNAVAHAKIATQAAQIAIAHANLANAAAGVATANTISQPRGLSACPQGVMCVQYPGANTISTYPLGTACPQGASCSQSSSSQSSSSQGGYMGSLHAVDVAAAQRASSQRNNMDWGW